MALILIRSAHLVMEEKVSAVENITNLANDHVVTNLGNNSLNLHSQLPIFVSQLIFIAQYQTLKYNYLKNYWCKFDGFCVFKKLNQYVYKTVNIFLNEFSKLKGLQKSETQFLPSDTKRFGLRIYEKLNSWEFVIPGLLQVT